MATHSALPAFLNQTKAELSAKFVDLEWQQRNRLRQGSQSPPATSPPSQWSRLTGDAITSRNRYLNVEPYAQNRITLKVADGAIDYINASPILLGNRRYIATQGPKDSGVNHFYRMVASELKSPAVVVMLTQTHEAGREKCFQYYPLSEKQSPLAIPPDEDSGDGFQGSVDLVSTQEDEKTRTQIRRLRLRTIADNGQNEEMEIHHLLFSAWPDFLVPEGDDREALVELVRLSALLNRNPPSHSNTDTNASSFAADLAVTDQDNPRIIHCSAGVGRSGTFIALDYLLSLMYSGQLDNLSPDQDPIAEVVNEMRNQRMMMVQGEPQFRFLYETMREKMTERLNRGDAQAGAQARNGV